MIVRFGYVAMSTMLENASPSHTMTATQFEKLEDREAGLRKLLRIGEQNLGNCMRLLKHNLAYDISFFRLSSKLVPLVNHPLTEGWRWDRELLPVLREAGELINVHGMRVDFHPDHFVVLNTGDHAIFKRSLNTLLYHYKLLKGMGQSTRHRCVLHIGGKKQGVETGLETFIERFQEIPTSLSQMLMVENDDKNYTINDALYLGEKLEIPIVFDLHHHDVHGQTEIADFWGRVVQTWETSALPMKMHISSPKAAPLDRNHADYIDANRFLRFLKEVNGSVKQLDVMIEAKQKDAALVQLMTDLEKDMGIKRHNQSTIELP
ncbi:UV DNA damage repair endonuclease UvsE [Alteribacter populi]|uniref:UV DNA damage repair endonuclease UvsE n=1 Tax=Alteribacter populi TaxID=2011011 RepID=UPI000BBAD6F3|nr:UV DNA damage repair endonuclease UvsE [Alteribacter populi]